MAGRYAQHNSKVVALRVPLETLVTVDRIAQARGLTRTQLLRDWFKRCATEDQVHLDRKVRPTPRT